MQIYSSFSATCIHTSTFSTCLCCYSLYKRYLCYIPLRVECFPSENLEYIFLESSQLHLYIDLSSCILLKSSSSMFIRLIGLLLPLIELSTILIHFSRVKFFFYTQCLFRMWPITALHNFPYFEV